MSKNPTTADDRHICDYPVCSVRGAGHPLACNCRAVAVTDQKQTTPAPRDHMIRKGGYYYRANWSGYTADLIAAGLYTKEEAQKACQVEPWHMDAIPAPPWVLSNSVARDVAERILTYFDSYKIGSLAPVIAEIEKALTDQKQGAIDNA